MNEVIKEKRKVGRPTGKTKKSYAFTLKPTNRDKLDQLAKDQGHTASSFLDAWIEKEWEKREEKENV